MAMKRAKQADEHKIAAVISMVPLKVRERVDQLAQREQVSRSEIGRRAIERYVDGKTDKQGK